MGALSSFLRSENYEAKKDFIVNYKGLELLSVILQDENTSLRMLKRVLFLLLDMILNDSLILAEGNANYVK